MRGKYITTQTRSIDSLVKEEQERKDKGEKHPRVAPLPLEILPNYMGINLCSVESITWARQDDGQLLSLSVQFIPSTDEIDMNDYGFVTDREESRKQGRLVPKYRVYYEYPDERGVFPPQRRSQTKKS